MDSSNVVKGCEGDSAVGTTQSVQNPNGSLLEGQPSVQTQNQGYNVVPDATSARNDRSSLVREFSPELLIDDIFYEDSFPFVPISSVLEPLEHRFNDLNLSPSTCFVPNNGFGLTDFTSYDVINEDGFRPELQRIEQIWSHHPHHSTYLSNGYAPGESSTGSYYRANNFYVPEYVRNNSSYMASPGGAAGWLTRNPNIYSSSRNNHNNLRNAFSTNIRQPRPFDYSHLPLRNLRGRIPYYAKNLSYSQFWKGSLERASQEEIDMVFSELIDGIGYLSTDPSATHVIQKLIAVCSDQQRTHILVMMLNSDFVALCVHHHGSYALRQVVRFLNSDEQFRLFVNALCSNLVEVAKSVNGHHVIQDCLERFPFKYIQMILVEASKYCMDMAMDQHGCFTLQDLIKVSSTVQLRASLVCDIIRNAVELSDHRYGNYAVQFVLGLGHLAFTDDLVQQLRGHYANLACSKFGSHVVQKCLTMTLEKHSRIIISELLSHDSFYQLLNDPFGNFVVQSALQVAEGDLYVFLGRFISKNFKMLDNNKYGKKVLDWFEKKKARRMNNPVSISMLQR